MVKFIFYTLNLSKPLDIGKFTARFLNVLNPSFALFKTFLLKYGPYV